MREYICPACGAPGRFHASISVYAVCAYCQSMILRHDVDVEAFGKMAALPPDMSPLQIGTRGVFDGIGFALVGRLKIGWQDGHWNEWFMFTEDARKGWLAEAQGYYAVCFEEALQVDGRERINRNFETWKPQPGERLFMDQQAYEVVDIKDCICLGSEGELPLLANRGRRTKSIDLAGGGGFASLELYSHGARREARFYSGRYVEWDALKLENTRPLEGW